MFRRLERIGVDSRTAGPYVETPPSVLTPMEDLFHMVWILVPKEVPQRIHWEASTRRATEEDAATSHHGPDSSDEQQLPTEPDTSDEHSTDMDAEPMQPDDIDAANITG